MPQPSKLTSALSTAAATIVRTYESKSEATVALCAFIMPDGSVSVAHADHAELMKVISVGADDSDSTAAATAPHGCPPPPQVPRAPPSLPPPPLPQQMAQVTLPASSRAEEPANSFRPPTTHIDTELAKFIEKVRLVNNQCFLHKSKVENYVMTYQLAEDHRKYLPPPRSTDWHVRSAGQAEKTSSSMSFDFSDTPARNYPSYANSFIAVIPIEVWWEIGSYLPVTSLMNLSLISRLHADNRDHLVWCSLMIRTFGIAPSIDVGSSPRHEYFCALSDAAGRKRGPPGAHLEEVCPKGFIEFGDKTKLLVVDTDPLRCREQVRSFNLEWLLEALPVKTGKGVITLCILLHIPAGRFNAFQPPWLIDHRTAQEIRRAASEGTV